MDSLDDFPDILGTPPPQKTEKRQGFAIGGDDDDDDLEEENFQELDPLEEELDQSDDEGCEQFAAPAPSSGADTHNSLAHAAAAALSDPAVRALADAVKGRFKETAPQATETSRVTRGWLSGLNQRDFFLALAYPGYILYRLTEGDFSMATLKAWVDGLMVVPPEQRKILTLENLLERRTQSSRDKMPRRDALEKAIRKMPLTAAVSDVLGGFTGAEAPAVTMFRSNQLPSSSPEGVADLIRVVGPEEQTFSSGRQGSSLPLSSRLQGKGRPIGATLNKPNSYCYTISRRSIDPMTGHPRISPAQVMMLINRMAALEVRHKICYSMRRADTKLPWSVENIELLPTEEMERSRGRRSAGYE